MVSVFFNLNFYADHDRVEEDVAVNESALDIPLKVFVVQDWAEFFQIQLAGWISGVHKSENDVCIFQCQIELAAWD